MAFGEGELPRKQGVRSFFDIVELTYYENVFWQSDLIFVRNELAASIDALNPGLTKRTFEAFKYQDISRAYLKNQ